ncbi:hypothetical protein E2C01_094454 [Portunus trituberculatus]|uniref:Uncharacterized protein n=1 Tax=Portunus trituberculatus TaxID=210409 RepID=A0A5B7JW66_PORTR|nr:hypothetical protein [Portunus trituberculatus]
MGWTAEPSFLPSSFLAILPLPSFPGPSAAQPKPTTGSNNVNTINHPYAGVLVGHYRTLNETTCAKPVVVNERFGSPSSHFIIMCASITTFKGGYLALETLPPRHCCREAEVYRQAVDFDLGFQPQIFS